MKSNSSNIFFLLGILVVGYLNNSVAEKKDIGVAGESGAETGNLHNSDDFSYSDDEDSPAEQLLELPKSTNSTLKPYFNNGSIIEYVKPGNKVVLACPVQNYNATKHEIIWFKEENAITTGETPFNKAYVLDKSFQLTIENFTDEMPGNYYCKVVCGKYCVVQQHILVIAGEKPPVLQLDSISDNQSHLSASLAIVTYMLIIQKLFTWTQYYRT